MFAVLVSVTMLCAAAYGDDLSKVSLADLSFISGKWQGSIGTSTIEEHWMAPSGDNMLGMYRIMKDGKGTMYELCIIEQTPNGPVLKIKHFNPGLVGWEDKTESATFGLIAFEKNKATFEILDKQSKLIFHRASAGELIVTLDKAGKDGKRPASVFKYTLMQ
jgi:hypothetical protein